MAPQRVIGVDLGGTKIATGSVDADGGLHERHEVRTVDGEHLVTLPVG